MSGTSQEQVVNKLGTGQEHVRNMSGTCQEHVRNMSGTCREHVGSMSGTCQEQARNMSEPSLGPYKTLGENCSSGALAVFRKTASELTGSSTIKFKLNHILHLDKFL